MKFQFEKHPAKKGTCPSCNKSNVFRHYQDLPREYGICDRINECGYHNSPHDESLEKQQELTGMEVKRPKEKDPKIVFPDKASIKQITNDLESNFHYTLGAICNSPENIPNEYFQKWGVGANNGGTCFVLADKKKVYNVKTIYYQPISCKRDKARFPFYLKADKNEKYIRCLYGLHLLSEEKTICLVESEKTAFLASFYYPQFDWLATGGNNGLTSEMLAPLENRKVFYVCDADKAGRDNATINRLKLHKDFHIVDLFPDREDGYDFADYLLNDYLLEENHIEIKEPEKPKEESPKQNNPGSIWEMVEDWINENYEIRNNKIANRIEYKPKAEESKDEPFTEINENDIFRDMQINHINFSMNKLKAMLGSNFVELYNPFEKYFEDLDPYDPGTEPDYIAKIIDYIPMNPNDHSRWQTQFKKYLVRSVACSLGKAINKNAIVIANSIQSSGKSTFCRWLCPPELSNYIAENIQTDKDSLIAMCTNFIINMDEMATLSKSDISALKSVMSKDVFKGRLPYAARETRLQRVANIIGSTNNLEFLSDETGNVRWIVFEMTDRTNFAYQKELDINRIWAQAYHLFKSGFYFEMTDLEMIENEEHNKNHMIRSIEQELIQSFFYPPGVNNFIENTFSEIDLYFKTATDIKAVLSEKAPHEKTILNNIGKALKILGYERKTIRKNGFDYPVKGYYIVNK